MSLPDLDILEVKSVSDMISVFETPADDAAKLIGEDDVAIFSPQLDLMIVTSQYDLEEPATTSQTVILRLADAECTWPDPLEYISDIVFECRWPSGARLVTEFQTFSDENATPSASLEYYRKRFAEGGTCMVFSEYDEAYLLDLKGKRHASRVDNQDGTPIAGKRPAADTASPADLAHRAACARGAAACRWKTRPRISSATDFRRFSMFMYAVKKPAVAAAAALGEDGTAVFCEDPGCFSPRPGARRPMPVSRPPSSMSRKATSTTATGGFPVPGVSPRSSSICPRRWAKSSPAGSRTPRS
ncbi:MAG: hypothetical protein ACLT5H_06315 [Collinsella stercoris]|uniref:hypothetical protein n=1 Tax=Collinsella stercoris TaxID=147206 RepID=UPI003992DCE4